MTLTKLTSLGLSAAILTHTTLSAIDFGWGDCETYGGTIDLSGGYRNECLHFVVDNVNIETGETVIVDNHKVTNLNVWEIGGKARGWYGNWFARGFIYAGWTDRGHWDRKVSVLDVISKSDATVHSGKTVDASIGAGYLFLFKDCYQNRWGFGPVAGWAYDRLRYKIKHVDVNDIPDPTLNNSTFTQIWEGPWLGADLFFQNDCLLAHLGYEYHWANWDRKDRFGQSTVSDHFRSTKAGGNLVYLDARWLLWADCSTGSSWTVGLGLKYMEFQNHHGRLVNEVDGFDAIIKKAKWRVGEITADFGYIF